MSKLKARLYLWWVQFSSPMDRDLKFIFAVIIGLIIILFGYIANAQTTYTKTIKYDIMYGQALGVHDTMENLFFDVTKPNNTKDHALIIALHGGGGFLGDKGDGLHPLFDGLVSSLGVTVAYPNYRLADTRQFLHKTIDQCTILMHEEMYRSLQDAYACVNYMLSMPSIYHIDKNQIWIAGVSWGAVCGVMAVHWQPSEYADCDTMKWMNHFAYDYTFNIAGGIAISGAAFTMADIDVTDKPLILCYGGKDNTLKCFGGSNHKCPYIGSCQIIDAGETPMTSNPVYPFYIADAGHCMKGTTQIETALNLLDTKAYIKSTLRNLIK